MSTLWYLSAVLMDAMHPLLRFRGRPGSEEQGGFSGVISDLTSGPSMVGKRYLHGPSKTRYNRF